jgi:hypothetical protein
MVSDRQRRRIMPQKRYRPEEIIAKLQFVELPGVRECRVMAASPPSSIWQSRIISYALIESHVRLVGGEGGGPDGRTDGRKPLA